MVSRKSLFCGVGIALVLALATPAVSLAKDTDREGKYELYFPVRWIGSESFSADGGTSLDINPDVGWGFGFAWNATNEIAVQFELDWTSANFSADIITDNPAGTSTVGGTLDASTALVSVQYNIIPKTVTPFITVGAGWTWADSNIPTGPPQGACWWSPWYGYICSSWQPTASESAFTYGAGLGVRGEVTESFYLEASYNWTWNNFDVADSFEGFRLDIGWKF